MATPRPFYARHFGVRPRCDAPIEKKQIVAFHDEQLRHVEHHDDAAVRERGKSMPPEPPKRKKWRGR